MVIVLWQECRLSYLSASRYDARVGREGCLKEGVIDDVTLVVFTFDDPVTGIGFAVAGVGEEDRGLCALRCVDQKRSASAKGVHSILLTAVPPSESISPCVS